MISQGFHRGFTAAEKTELWDRWQREELLKRWGERLVSRHHLFISSFRTVGFVLRHGVARDWH